MASSESSNMQAARQANAEVKDKLTMGPGNRWYSHPIAEACVNKTRRASIEELNRSAKDIKRKAAAAGQGEAVEWAKWEGAIAIWAKNAAKNHCGNCGEHAAVAFIYLRDRGVRPIEYMGYVSGIFEDHAFVVIGRKAQTDLGNPAKWGADVVICDPYYDKAYLATSIIDEMGSKAEGEPKLICRMS